MMKPWNQRTFLYIDGRLHRKLKTNKANDIYMAQDCQTNKIKTYSYKVIRDTHEKAYPIREVSEFLGRTPTSIRKCIKQGVVDPQTQSNNANPREYVNALGVTVKNTGRVEYYFSKEDLFDLREHYASGSPYARTGKLAVPTKEELRAMLEQNVVLYVKSKNGDFVPTWQAVEL